MIYQAPRCIIFFLNRLYRGLEVPANDLPLGTRKISKVADLTENVRCCYNGRAEPRNKGGQQLEIVFGEALRALELLNALRVHLTNHQQNEKVGVYKHAFSLMLFDQSRGVCHLLSRRGKQSNPH